jgi:type IV secretion system protein TrbI
MTMAVADFSPTNPPGPVDGSSSASHAAAELGPTEAELVDPDDDPHASKIAPDDPRLNVPRPRSRVLRSKRVLGVAVLCIGATAFAMMRTTRDPKSTPTSTSELPKVPVRPPEVPAFLQDMPPASPAPLPPRATAPAPPSAATPPLRREERPSPPPPRPDPLLERQAQLDEQARTSSLFFQSSAGAASGRPSPTSLQPTDVSPMPPGVVPAAVAPAGSQTADDPNFQARKNAFLDAPPDPSDYLLSALQPALSPYEVKATTVIPATLLTGINSDLPGPIIAQVRERVYDSVTGEHLLIPQGSRLLAAYDSMVAWGQERVLLCWQRLIFPNGSSINLRCMPASDLAGQAGLADQVDNHWDRLLAATGLSTVLSLGAQAAAGDPSGYQANLAQRAAGNAAGQINSAGQAVVARQLNLQPTITIRPGFGVNVVVTKDMVLEPYLD